MGVPIPSYGNGEWGGRGFDAAFAKLLWLLVTITHISQYIVTIFTHRDYYFMANSNH